MEDSHPGRRLVPAKPSPLVVGDQFYMISDNGILTCLDAKPAKRTRPSGFLAPTPPPRSMPLAAFTCSASKAKLSSSNRIHN